MPFDTSGTFTRIRGADSWKGDAAADTPIRSDLHDTNDNDLANGLSGCITKDGRTQPTANIPFNTQKIINLGQPDNPQDAATKRYVDEMPGWPTAKYISGAGVDGRLNFTSLTGANGITWSNIGAAWLARVADVSGQKERNRVVLNNQVDGLGSDVIAIDENDGSLMFPSQFQTMANLIYDGVSFRTPVAGTGGIFRANATSLAMFSNSVATTLAYGVTTVEKYFEATSSGGTVWLTLNKKADTNYAGIIGSNNGVARWLMQLGSNSAEDGSNNGSDFALYGYNNAASGSFAVMTASRATGKVTFPQGLAGYTTMDRLVTSYIDSPGTSNLIVGGDTIYVRPNGVDSATAQSIFDANGDLTTRRIIGRGYAECQGTGSSPNAGQIFNWFYNTSTDIRCYVGTSFVGTWTPACDYRIKKDDHPLPSTWDKVKALRPVSYTDRAYGVDGLFKDGDVERWGFLAHELQEALLPSAASGEKDGEDLQVPNHMAVIAALTAALQEAMVRIEALEARA